jgi:hypothetical protein
MSASELDAQPISNFLAPRRADKPFALSAARRLVELSPLEQYGECCI